VEQVNWHEAIEFCRRLSARTGKNYTLPSEAQWEYACRAGTTTPFHFGDTISTELANYCAAYKYRKQTTDVASFPANPWGLHDMHGNVWEWCLDGWHHGYEGAPTDGSAEGAPQDGSAWAAGEERLGKSSAADPGLVDPTSAARPAAAGATRASAATTSVSASAAADQRKVLRGGSWVNHPRFCRSAYRYRDLPDFCDCLGGFRVCLTSNPAPAASKEAMADAREESQAAAWDGMKPEQVLPAVESLAAAIEPTPSAPALPPATAYDCGAYVVIQATSLEPKRWAVRDGSLCLNFSGEWEPEPHPSNRSADFLARTRWPSAEAAWAALLAHRAAKGVQS
jgi:hypothetical protein